MTDQPSDNSHSENHQNHEFRGTWVPAEMFFLLEEGKVSTPHFVMLCLIESYVKARGIGCYATNKQLATKIGGCTERHIRRMIKEMTCLGLLVRKEHPKYWRLLETTWSRMSREDENVLPPGGKCPPGGTKMSPKKSIKRRVLKNCCPTPSASVNGERLPLLSNEQNTQETFDQATARLLYEGLHRAGKIMRNPSTRKPWSDEIRKLVNELMDSSGIKRKQAQELVREVVHDHLQNLKDKYQPQAYSAQAFRLGFLRLQEARRRRLGEEQKSGPEEDALGF